MQTGYQVIARRWRPRRFDEVVGQGHIIRTLRNAIAGGRIAHAYLFVGPRGTGKTTTARLFAQALNAAGGPAVDPDPDSELSQAIMGGSCMDVIEIDGASNNSVDQVRDLRDDCRYAPAQCTFKIYIIDEVHMLSTQAFNALLKTLEEPPAHVKFIFATTEAQKVLPTIVSRCQRFEFRPIADGEIVAKLDEIATAEGIAVDPGALAVIARLANGGMRDAQSILDQMISFCGEKVGEQDVLDVYGVASAAAVDDLARAVAGADHATLLRVVDTLAEEGRDLYRVLVDLQANLRGALLGAIRGGGSTGALGGSLSTESLMRILDALHAGEPEVQRGLSERVNFEVTLFRAAEAGRTRAIDSVIRQLSGLAGALPPGGDGEDGGGASAKKKRPSPILVDPAPATPAPPGGDDRVAGPGATAAAAVPDQPPAGGGRTAGAAAPPAPAAGSLAPGAIGVEALADQIPESTRRLLQEQFRGRFVEVRHFQPDDLI